VAKSEVDGRALERQLAYNPDVTSALDKIGKAIADDARALAPKRVSTGGAGARSIHHEIGFDEKGAYVRISWDKRHFYMQFAEFGTSRQAATPFLRPAAATPRNI
jgi:HK97 gp10 family phage protein